MDIRTQHAERDRSLTEPSGDEDGKERSRSARMSAAASQPWSRAGAWWARRLKSGPGRLPGGRLTVVLLVCAVLVPLVGRFVLQPVEIPSGSMEPGLWPGDRVLVNRVAYRFGASPQRGDVVVFDGTGYFGEGDYIKRVVGVGGDHVVCCDSQGRIEVNGAPVSENRYLYPGDTASRAAFDVSVPQGRLFLLGDHRATSRDSRDLLGAPGGGMLPVDAVIGKAEWVAWPAGRWHTVAQGGTHGRGGVARPGGAVRAGRTAAPSGGSRG